MKATVLIGLCRACATDIYGTKAPTPAYGDAVARLLMGTAATESHLVYRRQGDFGFSNNAGAWGIWQTEEGSVGDNVKMLKARPELRARAAAFLYGDEGDEQMEGLLQVGTHGTLRMIHSWDRLAVLHARLHYFHKSDPVPAGLEAQAAYYKRWYNTAAGKGSVEKYIADWKRLVEPALG